MFRYIISVLSLTLWLGTSFAQPGTSAISRLNQYRADLGLSQLSENQLLHQTALSHSQYLAALPDRSILSKLAPDGTPEMHLQRAGNPKFIGTTLGDRTRHHGYRFMAGEQVVFNERYNNGADVVDQLMTTVYHRSGLLLPGWSELGAATGTPNAVLVLGEGSVRSKVPADWMAYYPANQSFARRIAFQNELPDPAPERPGQWLGLPISIHAVTGMRLQVQSFTLQKLASTAQPNAQTVSGKVLDSTRDKLVTANEVFFLPDMPLAYSSTYAVKAQLLINQVPRLIEWSFQTPPNPFMVLPQAPITEVTPGVPQLLELQGVQGNSGWQVNTSAPFGVNIDARNLGNGKMQINFPNECNASCRLTVTVRHDGPHPSSEVREFITNRTWLAAKPTPALTFPKELIAAANEIRKQSGAKALAYAVSDGRWVWSTGSSAGDQADINKTVLNNCARQAEQMGTSKCELYPL